MSTHEEQQLREIWKGQAVPGFRMAPEQLRARANQFETEIRRRSLRDGVSFALIAIIAAVGIVTGTGGVLIRVGGVLMVAWALLSIYWARLYGAMSVETGADAPTLLQVHRRQLERQRDIALSWPWGLGLVIPGFVLVCLGMSLGPRRLDWTVPASFIGVFMFVYVAVVIYGRMLAGRWQREIDALRALEG